MDLMLRTLERAARLGDPDAKARYNAHLGKLGYELAACFRGGECRPGPWTVEWYGNPMAIRRCRRCRGTVAAVVPTTRDLETAPIDERTYWEPEGIWL